MAVAAVGGAAAAAADKAAASMMAAMGLFSPAGVAGGAAGAAWARGEIETPQGAHRTGAGHAVPVYTPEQQARLEPAAVAAAAGAADEGKLYFLDAELRPISLSTACGTSEGSGLGLSGQWAARLSRCAGAADRRQALSVTRVQPGSGAHAALQEG